MFEKIESVGKNGLQVLYSLGFFIRFLCQLFCRVPAAKRLWQDLRWQMYQLGVLSFLIIVVSALFIGMVVGLQGYNTLHKFGASTQLGQLLALSVVRELGPVMSALLFAGRAGSALTAEIGLMNTTEQLASMDMMGVDPLVEVIYPRFLAGLFSLPLLALLFSATAIYGGYLVGVDWLGIDAGSFWSAMQSQVHFRVDIVSGIMKSMVFAFVIVWIALYQGFYCVPTALGISQATTRTVVYSSLSILGLDFLLTTIMIGGW
jgi:phospholipid/cholesterol/gamma-HCH transport system permease protein